MTQIIGVVIVALALVALAAWVWITWGKSSTVGQTTGGKIVSAAIDTATLTANLGYVELLSKIDVVKASPDAVKACDILADTLWQGAIAAWKTAQTVDTTTSAAVIAKTAKVTTTDGTVVEVPVQ
ncbi:MAG: hypothetical protein WC919_06080 [Candidatus Paceibacterota bacterium]|jgi:hypothetical protein